METMAWHCLFGNVEERFDEYGIGYICCVSIWFISQLEGSFTGVFDIVGTIVECNDVHIDFLFESELWIVEEVL
jgi:hypothetical protein